MTWLAVSVPTIPIFNHNYPNFKDSFFIDIEMSNYLTNRRHRHKKIFPTKVPIKYIEQGY